MPTWDHAQYLKFGDERTRAARELLARVPLARPSRVIDLGCGPGNSTALLRERWPAAHVVGVDNSREMLAKAREADPNVEWIEADAASFEPEPAAELLFANAVFQWLPEHAALFPKLLSRVPPGGALAVQMPHNSDEPSHRAMRETYARVRPGAADPRAGGRVENAAFYYDLLAPSARSVDIWQTTYEHVLEDAAAIVEWVKGTGLRPYLEALEPARRAQFLEEYTRAIDQAYPARRDGRRLFSFPRLFIVAVR